MRIDAHNHFWIYDPVRDAWIDDSMEVIRRDFLPDDLEPILNQNSIDGTISVQADQSEKETLFLLEQAENYKFIKGIVGWIDLQSESIQERLHFFQTYKKLKGIRHIAQAEANDFLISPDFVRGIETLSRTEFTYDILVFPPQLPAAIQLVSKFPNQVFILDHIAKPYIKSGEINKWAKSILSLAAHDNVFCKISGLITEADWTQWKAEDFRPYLEVVVEAFGCRRLMYGSDYPVCLLAGSYEQVLDLAENYFQAYSTDEQQAIFGGNAQKIYNI